MNKLYVLSAGLILAAGIASASVTADQLVATYQAQGYTTIDVTTGVSQIKVEAVVNQTQIEVVYDIATGAILGQEQSAADPKDANQGVEVAVSDQDFLNGDGVKTHGKSGTNGQSGETENESADAGEGGTGGDDSSGHDAGDDNGGDHGGDHEGSGGSGSDD